MKKKKITKFHQITPGAHPKVLLTGNGMTLAFKGAQTIDALIEAEWGKHHIEPYPNYMKEMPFPMRAVVSTQDDVSSCMKAFADCLVKTPQEPEQVALIRNVIDTGFDVIMTTNYSLEFESGSIGSFTPQKSYKYYQYAHKQNTVQEQLGIFQCTELPYGCRPKLWHIHGTALRKKSMVFGQYDYGKLLAEINNRSKNTIADYKTAITKKRNMVPVSWVDYFLMGDVYCFGFGLDISESDIWWLLACKKNHFPESKFFYYDPKVIESKKRLLLECYGAEIIEGKEKKPDYIKYYERVCEEIKESWVY